MRTKGSVFLAIVACVAFAQAAAAADLGGAPRRPIHDESVPYGPAFSWTGLYIGANVGYGWSNADWGDALSGVSTSNGSNGWLAGGQIGYNFQVRQFVFGIETDFSTGWLDGSSACPAPAFNCSHSYNWLASLRGRLGVAVNDNRTLLYATGGAAWADVDYAAKDAVTGASFGTGFSNTHMGWVAGAGIEHMLTQNLTARIEYLYYGFDSVTAPAGALAGGPTNLNPTTQTVRFGLNFKF
jgi:outer membrane immunogenic protein